MKSPTLMLWSGIAVPPLAWFLNLEANFAMAPLACGHNGKPFLYGVSVIALLLTAGAGSMAWMAHIRLNHSDTPGAEVTIRKQSMAVAGLVLSIFAAMVILAQTIPNVMLAGCD